MPAPFTEHDIFEISNRARALENNMYIVAPNIGSYHLDADHPVGIDAGGGQSMIVDYKGQLVGKQRDTNGSTFVAGVINIEALRHHRESAQVTNWMKDVRAELAQIIYEKSIYPKNRYIKQIPPKHADYKREVIDEVSRIARKRRGSALNLKSGGTMSGRLSCLSQVTSPSLAPTGAATGPTS